jgi:hypothetical protein
MSKSITFHAGDNCNETLKAALMQPDVLSLLIHEIVPEARMMQTEDISEMLESTASSSMNCNLNGKRVCLDDVIMLTLDDQDIYIAITVSDMPDNVFEYHDIGLKATCKTYFSNIGMLYLIHFQPNALDFTRNEATLLA